MGIDFDCSNNNHNNNMYTKSNPKSIVKIKHKVPWQDEEDSDTEYDINGTKIYRPSLPIRKTSSRKMSMFMLYLHCILPTFYNIQNNYLTNFSFRVTFCYYT